MSRQPFPLLLLTLSVLLGAASAQAQNVLFRAGGGLATHAGCDEAFRNDMIEIAKLVWASEDYAGWITSSAVLLNNFQLYGDECVDFYNNVARVKGMAAYDILVGGAA